LEKDNGDAGKISVHVVSVDDHAQAPPSRGVTPAQPARLNLKPYLIVTAYVAAAVLFGLLLSRVLDVRNIALVFLMAVLASAVTVGLWPAIFASVLSAMAFNFFFLDPLYTLDISDPESAVALGFFFCVAVIASNLTARVQRQAVAAQARARTTEDLYLFSKKLAGTGTLDDVLWATAFQIASMLKLRVVLLLPENGSITVKAGYPPTTRWPKLISPRRAGPGSTNCRGARCRHASRSKAPLSPVADRRTAVGVVGLTTTSRARC
jgi:two-component system sensor histidine kinase KdpD